MLTHVKDELTQLGMLTVKGGCGDGLLCVPQPVYLFCVLKQELLDSAGWP